MSGWLVVKVAEEIRIPLSEIDDLEETISDIRDGYVHDYALDGMQESYNVIIREYSAEGELVNEFSD